MPFTHGTKARIWLDDSAGTLTEITAYVSTVTFPMEQENAETTTLNKTAKTRLVGLRDSSVSLEGFYDPAIDAILNAAFGAASRTFRYQPQGTGTGLIQYDVEVLITSYEASSETGDASPWSAEFEAADVVTRTVLP